MVQNQLETPNTTQPVKPKKISNRKVDQYSLTLANHLLADRSLGDQPVIGFTSCNLGEGVSTVAANVAAAAATICERPVVLLDANPTKPAVAKRFRCSKSPGWFDVLAGTTLLAECIQETKFEKLSVIPAGTTRGNQQRYPHVDIVVRLLDELKQSYDFVVVDLPPATQRSNTFSLAGELDGVVMVVEAEKARNKVAQRIKHQLERAGANLVGAVLNKRYEHVPSWLYRRL